MKINLLYLIISGIIFYSCTTQKNKNKPITKSSTTILQPTNKVILPEVNREFRAAWIATVANINWPSRNNLTIDQQKAEAITILEKLKDANFNAVIFQARPSADAFYKSNLEPWSYFLTGTLGKNPGYDPLEFWVSEAHNRGMELHAWLNPYRAYHTTGGEITAESMVKKMPNEVMKLRNGTYWFDPANEKVQNHVSAIILDLVNRYEIDGIHLDDYFYPYREYNYGRDFPDEKSFKNYQNSNGSLSKADWRRHHVNQFVKRIYTEIKATKKPLKFGISPFGIWKSGFPEDVTGTSQYDEIFADAKLWLNQGWIDYYSPQLYWKEEGAQRFSSLLKWWKNENSKNRHLWPGLNTVAVKDVENRPLEIGNQILKTREILKSKGAIHYSIDGISKNPEMFLKLKNLYNEKALVPATLWIKTEPLEKPEINYTKTPKYILTHWKLQNDAKVFQWVLYTKYGETWHYEILTNKQTSQEIPILDKNNKKLNAIAIKAIDFLSNESDESVIILKN